MLPRLLPRLRPLLTGVSVAWCLGALGAPAVALGAQAAPVHAGAAVTGGHPSPGWPWAVALLNDWMPPGHDYSRSFCSGALIAPAVVLTAAHCVGAMGSGGVQVVVGEDDLTLASEFDAIAVTEIRLHPSADLAVLQLDHAADQQPAPLARAGDWAGSATGAGFGDSGAGSGEGSPELLSLGLRLRTDRTCRSWWDDSYDARTMLCAGGTVGEDMCAGDSGGPLMVDDGSGGWRLLGVTLFGDAECGASGAPGVFAWAAGPALRTWLVAQGATSPPSPVRTTRAGKARNPSPSRRRS
jgi:secreted trypsin-like serine protease